MSTKHSIYVAGCAGTIAFVLVLLLPAFVEVPLLWYHPVEHTWTFEAHATGVAMDFFGRCLLATAAGAIVSITAYATARRQRDRELAPSGVAVLCVWTVSILLIAMAFVAWRQLHRPGAAETLPGCVDTTARR
jgi:hypothetical protein